MRPYIIEWLPIWLLHKVCTNFFDLSRQKLFDIEYCRDRQNERIASGNAYFADKYILEKQRKDREKKLGVISTLHQSTAGVAAHAIEI